MNIPIIYPLIRHLRTAMFPHETASEEMLLHYVRTAPPSEFSYVSPAGQQNIMHTLAKSPYTYILKIALERHHDGLCLDWLNDSDKRPLDKAVYAASLNNVRLILEAFPDCVLNTALRLALNGNHADILDYLLSSTFGSNYIKYVSDMIETYTSSMELNITPKCAHDSILLFEHDVPDRYITYQIYKVLIHHGIYFTNPHVPLVNALMLKCINSFTLILDNYDPRNFDINHTWAFYGLYSQYPLLHITLLQLACIMGRPQFTQVLLERMTPEGINYQNPHRGWSALHFAVHHHSIASVGMLCIHTDTVLSLTDKDGRTAEYYTGTPHLGSIVTDQSDIPYIYGEMSRMISQRTCAKNAHV